MWKGCTYILLFSANVLLWLGNSDASRLSNAITLFLWIVMFILISDTFTYMSQYLLVGRSLQNLQCGQVMFNSGPENLCLETDSFYKFTRMYINSALWSSIYMYYTKKQMFWLPLPKTIHTNCNIFIWVFESIVLICSLWHSDANWHLSSSILVQVLACFRTAPNRSILPNCYVPLPGILLYDFVRSFFIYWWFRKLFCI